MTQDNTENNQANNNTSADNAEQGNHQLDPIAARDQKIAELETQLSQMNEKVMLAAAEYQNIARRARNSIGEAREQNTMDIAKGLLQSLDLFDMALACDPKKVSAESILMGVQMVHSEMVKSLESFGIKRVSVKPGDEFNPHIHEAVARISAPGVPSGKIAGQLQCGYVYGDKPLRPVKVNVAE